MKRNVLFIILMGIITMGLFGCSNLGGFSKAKLVSYSYSSGGDMIGSSNSTELSIINDKVYLTVSESESWADDGTVTEYQLDEAVLSEIKDVFDKYGMNRWNNKKFTNMFVSDGASYSYHFYFDNEKSVYFSSQIYPEKYRKKLREIQEIINKYMAGATAEPGLVKKELTPEEKMYKRHPENGNVELDVYEYSMRTLKYRIMNGTSDDLKVANRVKLVNNDSSSTVYEENSTYDIETYANYSEEEYIGLNDRLAVGKYTLYVGDYSVDFEIK